MLEITGSLEPQLQLPVSLLWGHRNLRKSSSSNSKRMQQPILGRRFDFLLIFESS
jgi:hypothetical protein